VPALVPDAPVVSAEPVVPAEPLVPVCVPELPVEPADVPDEPLTSVGPDCDVEAQAAINVGMMMSAVGVSARRSKFIAVLCSTGPCPGKSALAMTHAGKGTAGSNRIDGALPPG